METRIPQNPAEEAQAFGFPLSLFGFTPDQSGYWREPGLPWFTEELRRNPPLGYDGWPVILFTSWIKGNAMAPRFPGGCAVHTAPVYDKKNLVVGRVYLYRYQDADTSEWHWNMARLVEISGNYLGVKADNDPVPSIWLLDKDERKAVWNVREVTHYASYPAL